MQHADIRLTSLEVPNARRALRKTVGFNNTGFFRARARAIGIVKHHRRDIGRGTGGFDLPAQPVGVIGLVGEHDGALAQMPEQTGGDRAIARLPGRQDQFERQAMGIGQSVDLGRQPAARAAHTAIRVTFFELAAC